ncbi:MAG: hypothetical protein ACI4N3_05130 [Alphaproteobacteria bacterium]
MTLFSCKVKKDGTVVDRFEVVAKNQYVFIDNDGDEDTIENILFLRKEDLENYPVLDQLQKGSQIKYKTGKNEWVYLKNVLEVDGVKQK